MLFTQLFLCVFHVLEVLLLNLLGCNNGIGFFNENLVSFRDLKLPDFVLA